MSTYKETKKRRILAAPDEPLIGFMVKGLLNSRMDMTYSQASIFTPSDFAFPHDAVAAETTPNTEMTLIADVDLDLLKELWKQGSVRNLESRRKDLYRVEWIGKSG